MPSRPSPPVTLRRPLHCGSAVLRMELTGWIVQDSRGATRPIDRPNQTGMTRKHQDRLLSGNGLAANAQSLQNRLVALRIRVAQVRQKPATLRDHGQEPLAGTMVL